MGELHCAYGQECKHEDHAYNTEDSTDVCLKVWTLLKRELHFLTEEVQRLDIDTFARHSSKEMCLHLDPKFKIFIYNLLEI